MENLAAEDNSSSSSNGAECKLADGRREQIPHDELLNRVIAALISSVAESLGNAGKNLRKLKMRRLTNKSL